MVWVFRQCSVVGVGKEVLLMCEFVFQQCVCVVVYEWYDVGYDFVLLWQVVQVWLMVWVVVFGQMYVCEYVVDDGVF